MTVNKQARSIPVMNSVITAVAERLMDTDESLIRIPEICDATGVNYGSVYHHFGSREGVIDAAMVRIFTDLIRTDVESMTLILGGSKTKSEFATSMAQLFASINSDPARQSRRQMRARIVAAALARPALREEIGAVQSEVTDVFTGLCAEGQVRGWLRTDVSARMMAVLMMATNIGRTVDDISAHPIDSEEWDNGIQIIFASFLTP